MRSILRVCAAAASLAAIGVFLGCAQSPRRADPGRPEDRPSVGKGVSKDDAQPRRSAGELIMGNVFGVPLGAIGFAAALPLCLPAGLLIGVPSVLMGDHHGLAMIFCPITVMHMSYCAGYDNGSWVFREEGLRSWCDR
jgi:hypothetical protein